MRTIWCTPQGTVRIIDQTQLPWCVACIDLYTVQDAANAISTMQVRGAPLIGATAAWGMALAMREQTDDLQTPADLLKSARPTAVNAAWAVGKLCTALEATDTCDRAAVAGSMAGELCNEDVRINTSLGLVGLEVLQAIHNRTQRPVQLMTICNAGWLATVDRGTAMAPVYAAQEVGLPIEVTCLETRPRCQGGRLTAWELQQQGVPHRIIVDSAAGSLLQSGQIDLVIAGTDRTAANGDVCNKIGTYPLALAAWDNDVPFLIAAPSSSIDLRTASGDSIDIEYRSAREVTHLRGPEGQRIPVTNPKSNCIVSPAFDVTPARLVTQLITEYGACAASADGISGVLHSGVHG